MARASSPVQVVFNGDPVVSATLAFFVLWVLLLLVQLVQTTKIITKSVNARRRGIYGPLLGGIACLSIS